MQNGTPLRPHRVSFPFSPLSWLRLSGQAPAERGAGARAVRVRRRPGMGWRPAGMTREAEGREPWEIDVPDGLSAGAARVRLKTRAAK